MEVEEFKRKMLSKAVRARELCGEIQECETVISENALLHELVSVLQGEVDLFAEFYWSS